jgi:hypothetical protein
MMTVVALVILVIVGYGISLWRHPLRRCRWCSGLGKHFGLVYRYANRPCRHCGGTGRRTRYGARTPIRGST